MAKNGAFEVIVLAAGLGKRMNSRTPKILHKICEKPILWWVLNSLSTIKPTKTVVVLGHGIEDVKKEILRWEGDIGTSFFAVGNFVIAHQKKQLGSGDAVKVAVPFVKKNGCIVVISGDVPLIRSDTLKKLISEHKRTQSSVTVLTSDLESPHGYGRIVRDGSGKFIKIVEEKDASQGERKITEINSGIYCFSNALLREAIKKIKPLNRKKEYYLTDVIEILKKSGGIVSAVSFASRSEVFGINNRWELAYAEKLLRLKINEAHAKNGVTFVDPENAYIGPEAKIGKDTVIEPNVFIKEDTVIGKNCVIGSGCYISGSKLGENIDVRCSYIYDSKIASDVKVGPFAHIRPGTNIKKNARVGNFTEIKKSHIGSGTKVSHLAYIGDATLEDSINVGAGAITCNYDGKNKHRTYIGAGSFVGSNVNLIAPVKIGRNVLIGAGSSISKDVPDNMLAIERTPAVIRPRKNLK